MKAAIFENYGPPEVLRITNIEKPIPKNNEVLIKMYATTASSGDVRLRKANPFLVRLYFGFTKPKVNILGVDIAGVVEAVGKDVTLFKKGDAVFGSTFDNNFGTYAEYKCMPEDGLLTIKPKSISFEEAAAIFFGGHSALHFLKKGQIKPGQNVLIYGASGALGTYGVQLAKHFGATVTGVCSTANIELITALGADTVIDYTKNIIYNPEDRYDIIFDTVGKSPFKQSVGALKKKGFYVRSVNMALKAILLTSWTNLFSSKKVIGGVATETLEDLNFLKHLVEEGAIKPVIDKVYTLDQIVEAHRYVEKGHKKGNVVITI